MLARVKKFLFDITPRIYRLPTVTYIRWMDKEFIINRSF